MVIKQKVEATLFDGNIIKYFKDNFGLEAEVHTCYGERDEIIVNLAAPIDCLRKFCMSIEFDFLLDKEELRKIAKQEGIEIDHESKDYPTHLTPIEPFDLIFGDYYSHGTVDSEKIYFRGNGETHPFTKLIRQKLIVMLLEAGDFKINEYILNGDILGFFPPHDTSKKDLLLNRLLFQSLLSGEARIEDIKDYFGERVGMFYGFLDHYVLFLLIPGVIGGVFYAIMIRQNNLTNSYFQIIMSVVMVLWAPLMLKFWKRKECMLALRWGTFDAEEDELERPEFVAPRKISPISGELIRFFPPYKRAFRTMFSYLVVITFLSIVLGTLAGIYFLQLTGRIDIIFRSVMTAVSIQLYNFMYNTVAVYLNNLENHRTDTEYEDALILKVFLFQFLNYYVSFFYLAFVQMYISDQSHCSGACVMEQLVYNVAIIVAVELLYVPVSKFVTPYLTFRYRRSGKKISVTDHQSLSAIEKEFLLAPYDDLNIILYSYLALAILFGYLTMFSAALPLAPLVVLLCVFVSNKADLATLLNYYQRPVPKPAQDIGSWQGVFTALTVISVVVNAGLVAFSMTFLNGLSTANRFWVFIGFQVVFFSYLSVVSCCIPDQPEQYKIQIKRIEFMQDTVLKRKDANRGGGF